MADVFHCFYSMTVIEITPLPLWHTCSYTAKEQPGRIRPSGWTTRIRGTPPRCSRTVRHFSSWGRRTWDMTATAHPRRGLRPSRCLRVTQRETRWWGRHRDEYVFSTWELWSKSGDDVISRLLVFHGDFDKYCSFLFQRMNTMSGRWYAHIQKAALVREECDGERGKVSEERESVQFQMLGFCSLSIKGQIEADIDDTIKKLYCSWDVQQPDIPVLYAVCLLFMLLSPGCAFLRWTCCYGCRRQLTTPARRAVTVTAPVTTTNSWTPRWSRHYETERRDSPGDAERPFKSLGVSRALPQADAPTVHRCVIYEKFYCPKWYTHHLKNTYFYVTNVQY